MFKSKSILLRTGKYSGGRIQWGGAHFDYLPNTVGGCENRYATEHYLPNTVISGKYSGGCEIRTEK